MIAALLAGACMLGPAQWSGTAQWLDAMACPALAVEAMLVSPPHDATERALVAHELMVAITQGSPDDPACVRASIELRRLLNGLNSMDAHRTKLVLLANDRAAAMQAVGQVRRDLLRGALQVATVMRHDLDADLVEAKDNASRRTLEALQRRVGLLSGLLQVQLQERPAEAASALRGALMDGPDPGHEGVRGIPSVMLESLDGAWAAVALAKLDLRSGNVDGAQAWVDRLIEVHSGVLRHAGADLIQDVLLAMPAGIRGDVLSQWDRGLHVDTLLAILSNTPELDRHVFALLERRDVRSQVIETLATSKRPLPAQGNTLGALASLQRAAHGTMSYEAARTFVDAAIALDGADAELHVALAQVLLAVGDFADARDGAIAIPSGRHKAQADAVAMLAMVQVAAREGVNSNDAVLRVLLTRMAARDGNSPLRHEAALRLAALGSTDATTAMALLASIPDDHALHALVLRQREVVAWRTWSDTKSGAAATVAAIHAVLDLEGPDAAACARRLLGVVRHADLDATTRLVLADRALAAIADADGVAAGRGARAAYQLASGDTQLALQTVQGAWADALRDPTLIDVARDLLAISTPLGEAAERLASRVLGRSPMAFRVDERTAEADVVLRQWARHLAGSGAMTIAAMEHAAALDVLDQDGLMRLGEQAATLQRWPVAIRAWGRAADLGGEAAGAYRLEQARALAHVDVAQASDLARQIAVLHDGTAVGDAAWAMCASLEGALPGGRP